MATYYVSNTGVSGAGSSSSPFTIAQAQAHGYTEGDTIILMGGEWPGIAFSSLPDNITITSDGVSLSGIVGTLGSEWTQETLNVNYSYSVVGFVPVGVTEGYGPLSTPAKSHHIARKMGHYIRASSIVNLEATPGSWYWDSGTGKLHIHPLNAPPSGSADNFDILRDGNCITVDSTQHLTIRDIESDRWVDTNGQVGYTVRLIGCQNCLIKNITAWDSGFHTFGGLGSSGDDTVSQNLTWQNCHAYGMADSSFGVKGVTINPFVCAATNSADANARQTGIRWLNCTAHIYNLLKEDGTPLYDFDVSNPGYTMIAFQTHDDTARCTDATVEGCTVVADYDGIVWRAPNVVTLATDSEPTNLLTGPYNNQVIDCTFYVNPSSFSANTAFNVLSAGNYYRRCKLYIQDDGTWTASAVAASAIDSGKFVLFDYCVFSGALLGNSANSRWFNVNDGGSLGLRGCTLITSGATTAGNRGAIATLGNTGQVYMRNVLSDGTANRIGFKSTSSGFADASQFDVVGFNAYNTASASYCVLGAADCVTLANWQANISATVSPTWPQLTGYIPAAASTIFSDANRHLDSGLSALNTLAIDNTVYAGVAGAYQFIGGGTRKNQGRLKTIFIEDEDDTTELQGDNIEKVRGI